MFVNAFLGSEHFDSEVFLVNLGDLPQVEHPLNLNGIRSLCKENDELHFLDDDKTVGTLRNSKYEST